MAFFTAAGAVLLSNGPFEGMHTGMMAKEMRKSPTEPVAVSIRPMGIDDASHIIDSWCRSYRRSIIVGPVDDDTFKIEQRARIGRLISQAKTFVACNAKDTFKIHGWICFEAPKPPNTTPIVHYVCVHPQNQMQGIGTALVGLARRTHTDPEAPMWCTHETSPMRHIRPKWNLLFNPYLLEVDHRVAAKREEVGHYTHYANWSQKYV